MGNIAKPALQELANIINDSETTKEAIVKTAEFDEKLIRAKEKMEQEKPVEEKEETFEFKPEEIQTLVNRKSFRDDIAFEHIDHEKALENLENSEKEEKDKEKENI